MRKFLPSVICGLAALSYSQLGAAAEADPGEKPAAEERANPSAANDTSGVTRDQSGTYRNKDDKRAAKRKGDADSGSAGSSSAGSSSAGSSGGKDDTTSPAPSSSGTPGSTPKGSGY